MGRLWAALVAAILAAPVEADRAGDFDYWILALSWTPSWCAAEGDARGAERCEVSGLGWSLHGLWPQYETGWPADCATPHAMPSRRETAAEADLFGSGGAAWHQWRKHGTCSGLSSRSYYDLARAAYDAVERPAVLREAGRDVTLPARLIEQAFLEADPTLFPDAITVTCRDGRVAEVRVCLSHDDLSPRRCGADVVRDCTLGDAALPAVR